MKTLQSIPLGNAAADSFLLLDDESVGRIVRALVYAARNELPAVPKSLRPVYFAVLAESCRIRGAKVPRPRDIRFADTPEDAQNCKADNAINVGNTVLDGNAILDGKGVEEKRREENRIDTDDTADAVSSGPAIGGLRSAGETSPLSADGLKEANYTAWAAMQLDPVDVALDVTGEPDAKRRVYGARLKALGRDRFVETCCTFRAEVEAGETVRNLGAALTKRLNDAIEAKEACAG